MKTAPSVFGLPGWRNFRRVFPGWLRNVAFAAPLTLLLPVNATAQSIQWDTNTTLPGAQGAVNLAGWTSGPFWWDGQGNVNWINGSDAVFGGTAGTVYDAAVTVDDITFTVPGYILRPNGPDFGLRLGGGEGAHVITVAGNGTVSHRLLGTEGFTKDGAGVLYISSANHTFTGTITINAGEVSISGGFVDPERSVVLGNVAGARLSIYTEVQVFGGLSGGGAVGGEVFTHGGLIVGGDNSDSTYAGVLTGNGSFTKNGTGTLTLTNANSTYTAPTLIEQGVISVPRLADDGVPNFLGIGTNIKISNGAALRITDSVPNATDRRLELAGMGTVDVVSSQTVVTWNGRISGDSFQKAGAGTMVLTANNTFTGSTAVNGGTLRVSGGNALADSALVTLAAGTLLELGNSIEAIGGLVGEGNVNLGSGTLRISSTSNTTHSGNISGTGFLEKAGPAVLSVSRAMFTGGLRVSEGTLIVGEVNPALPVTLGDAMHSGTLLGSFLLTAPLTVSAGGGTVNSIRIAGPLEGTGQLTLGAGVQLIGDKTFAGTIRINQDLTLSTNLPNAKVVVVAGSLGTAADVRFGGLELYGLHVIPGGSSIGRIQTSSLLLSGSLAGKL